MNKIIKNMSGITLLALTITIIVLLILTGVTSSVILSNNGLLENAMKARDESIIVEEKEQLNTAYSATTIGQTSKTTITDADAAKLKEELLKNVDEITVTVDIDEDGNKGFLVKFEKTGHYYFVEHNEVRTATKEEFNDNFTDIFAILYKRTNDEGNEEYDLRFNTTGTEIENNGWTVEFNTPIQTIKLNDNEQINLVETSSFNHASNFSPWYNYATNITSVTFEEKIVPQYISHWFYNFNKLTTINNLGKLHTHKVENMSYLFYKCYMLDTLDVSKFDTSKVKDMTDMFAHCTSLKKLDLSHFDTSNVQNMFHMFYDCQLLESLNLNNWNTSNVIDMNAMFAECTNLTHLDLSSFETSNVTTMLNLFNDTSSLQLIDMRNFTFDTITDFSYMFDSNSSVKIIVQEEAKQWLQNNINNDKIIITTVDELIS